MTTYTDEAALRKLHDELLSSLNSPDFDKLLSLLSDDIILMEPDMPAINGKAEVTRLFKKFREQKLAYKLSYIIQKLEVFGKTAFVHTQVMKHITQNNGEWGAGKFITLSQKQDDGKWLMQAIVNNDRSSFSFFGGHFKNSKRITKVTVTNEEALGKDMKDVAGDSPKDLVYSMLLSIANQ